jgi:hypothetical protein
VSVNVFFCFSFTQKKVTKDFDGEVDELKVEQTAFDEKKLFFFVSPLTQDWSGVG